MPDDEVSVNMPASSCDTQAEPPVTLGFSKKIKLIKQKHFT
jgi:hypothetical protein